jgi:GNAT superfamily N-acetyltransferase
MERFQFNVDVNPDAREIESLKDRIDAFNIRETGIYEFTELAIFLRDSMRELIAGIYAYAWGGCLDIRYLWVREGLRRAGIGSRLMAAVEQEAIRRGCRIATLETHSFQAPHFYEKLGYKEIGVLDGYPIGHMKYYLKKALSTEVDPVP